MGQLFIVMYHYVRDLAHSRYPQIKGLDTALFREQLDYLTKEFTPVRMEDVLGTLESGDDLPNRAVLFTFDDGYADHYETVFPELQRRNLQGSFFVPGKTFTEHSVLDVNKIHFILATVGIDQLKAELLSQLDQLRAEGLSIASNEALYAQYGTARMFDDADTVFCKSLLQSALPEEHRSRIVNRLFTQYVTKDEAAFAEELYMSKEQMLAMKQAGMFVGLHGYDHYWMNALSDQALQNDMEKALAATDFIIDESQRVINYPYGRTSPAVVSYMKSIGCKAGVTIERGVFEATKKTIPLPQGYPEEDATSDRAFLLPRFDCNDFPPKGRTWEKYLMADGREKG